jgi:hypothetical protein
MKKAKGGEQYHSNGYSLKPVVDTYADIDINKVDAHRWQIIADILSPHDKKPSPSTKIAPACYFRRYLPIYEGFKNKSTPAIEKTSGTVLMFLRSPR